MQSAFVVHAATHAPGHRFPGHGAGAQAIPLGQSAIVVQPQIKPGPGRGPTCGTPWQTVPPAPLVQSALVVQPHVPPLHTEPFALAAQSALVTQPTHSPVVVLQVGPPALPAQSALEAHARMHAPLRPGDCGFRPAHTKPAGQSAFDEQPHVGGPEQPPASTPSHT